MKKLIRNRCKCNKCKDIIESKHRHDFVRCKCGAIFTDGGTDYIHRGYQSKDDIIDLSRTEEFDISQCESEKGD
jgi:hypothetical protein